MSNNIEHINYALVEDVRPPMYKAMKYWGKKPHNIWSDYIETYCPENGTVLDPFMGSGIVAFESLILGRKAITFDLNPLSTFFIEATTQPFHEKQFRDAVDKLVKQIENDDYYKKNYTRKVNNENTIIYNYIWENGQVSKIRVKDEKGNALPDINPSKHDEDLQHEMDTLKIPYWFPIDKFPSHPSINQKFINDIGGDNYSFLWTRRNLYLLAKMFDLILQEDEKLIKPLLCAFIHTLHLVCKMVVPRAERGGRPYSGSWGRADYMIRKTSMEQNPLIVFLRSCYERQGVVNALVDANNRLAMKDKKINEVKYGEKLKNNYNLNYGAIDIADICDFIKADSIDFILTDPPYGGLVQYLDLSLIWLVWLKKFNVKYNPNLDAEITIKKGYVSREEYRRKMTNAFKNLHKVLKSDGYLVITFHNQDMREWNDFVIALKNAGFKFDKVTHQYNKRSGESNVSNPYGTTGSDFYIRCVKQNSVNFTDDHSELSHFILNKTIQIIAERAEPTPFSFVVNGLLPEMLEAGYFRPDEPAKELHAILDQHIGENKIFFTTKNGNGAGDYWWFNNPHAHINHPDLPLSDRVQEAVVSLLRRKVSVKLDDVIAELFKQYPNGLTPDPKGIKSILEKYARPISGKWKLKESVLQEATKHTDIISKLCNVGKKASYSIYVGKREQPEIVEQGLILKDLSDCTELRSLLLNLEDEQIKRIEMIDLLWLNGNKIECIFEVENSTNFTMAIQRASNAGKMIPKIMVIPDERENELKRVTDPLFIDAFKKENWHYLTYTEVLRISKSRNMSLDDVINLAHSL